VNTRTALLSLVVALVLVGAGWFFLRPKPVPPPPAPTWLRLLDPQQVGAISVKWADGQSAVIERSVVPGLWVLWQGPSKGKEQGAPWPVGINQVRGVLRLLADLDAVPPSDGKAPASGTTVSIRFQDGAEHALVMDEAALGGKTVVVVYGPPDTVRIGSGGLVTMFEGGLKAWRQPVAFGGNAVEGAGETSRIDLQTVGLRTKLGRAAGRWGVQFPVGVPADQGACGQVLQRLGTLPVKMFLENQPDSMTGLGSPSAKIETESDFRIAAGGDVIRRVLRQTVMVGGPADAGATKMYARVQAEWQDPGTGKSEVVWGPVLATIDRADLNGFTAEPTAYVSKLSVENPVADVSGFVLAEQEGEQASPPKDQKVPGRSVRVARTLDGWRFKPDQGEMRTPSPSEMTQIDALVHLVCEQPADVVRIEPVAGTKVTARIDVQVGAGPVLSVAGGVAEFASPGKPAQPALVLQVGPVIRVYLGKAALGVAQWISDELPPEG
jgi:hypothetical protein